MFDYADPEGDLTRIAQADASGLVRAGQSAMRLERQAGARKILAATALARQTYAQVMELCDGLNVAELPQKAALRAVALRFEVPVTTAGRWISLGGMLDGLPRVRSAFVEGVLSEHKARIVAEALVSLDDEADLAEAVEVALGLAVTAITGSGLREELEKLLISLDPAGAAERRREFEKQQDVRIRKECHGQSTIDAMVPVQDAVVLEDRIAGLVSGLCPGDPRLPGQRRVAALTALVRGEGRLVCGCGDPGCPTTVRPDAGTDPGGDPGTGSDAATDTDIDADTDADSPVRSTELVVAPVRAVVEVVVDAPTLAGVVGEMVPFIPGYGVIDPDLARTIAADGTWQGLYREARFDRASGVVVAQGVRKGRPRRAGTVAPGHLVAAGRLVVRSRPPNVVEIEHLSPVDPAGHGGLAVPPPGALVYQPGEPLRRQVLLTDRRCRAPCCNRVAEECQLDHVVPFDHVDPRSGGWTIAENLIPLCVPCHQFKHVGIWVPTLYPGRIVVWRNVVTGEVLVTVP
ncbi:DUF222 domain-containing protein [Gordonia sp. NPDC003376]